MPIKTILFLLISINLSAQQFSEKYNNLAIEAEAFLAQKQYLLAARQYVKAFQESRGTGMRMDLYNAAKAWSLTKNVDSAYYYLLNLASAKSFYALENLTQEKAFKPIRTDKRWASLLKMREDNRQAMTKVIPLKYKSYAIEGYEVLLDTVLINQHSSLKDAVIN